MPLISMHPKLVAKWVDIYFLYSNVEDQSLNWTIKNIAQILKNTICYQLPNQSWVGYGLFMNTRHAVPQQVTLEEMGHLQPPEGTPMQTDNTMASGILTNKCNLSIPSAWV